MPSALSMLPPALATSVLNQTATPSYWAPWISMRCGLPCLASWVESLIISSQVVGGFGTRSERYQSSWVLLLYGTAQSLPFHVAVSSGTFNVPLVDLVLVGAGPLPDPARLGELRRPR